jgi:hypothetical protein
MTAVSATRWRSAPDEARVSSGPRLEGHLLAIPGADKSERRNFFMADVTIRGLRLVMSSEPRKGWSNDCQG